MTVVLVPVVAPKLVPAMHWPVLPLLPFCAAWHCARHCAKALDQGRLVALNRLDRDRASLLELTVV